MFEFHILPLFLLQSLWMWSFVRSFLLSWVVFTTIKTLPCPKHLARTTDPIIVSIALDRPIGCKCFPVIFSNVSRTLNPFSLAFCTVCSPIISAEVMLLTKKSSLFIFVCLGWTFRPQYISMILHYFLITSCICLAVVVDDSSCCKVMQCVTYCHLSIMQCEHSSDWILPQIVVQCENNGDPMTLKIMLCELCISD